MATPQRRVGSARVAACRRGVELPVVRVVLERTPAPARGRVLRTRHDAARVLAPYLEDAPPTQRLALALLDARQRLLAVALIDGGAWSACCLRPSEAYAPALMAGAAGLYLAHGHPRAGLWAHSADGRAFFGVWHMGRALGVQVHDHLIFDARGRYASLLAADDNGHTRRFTSLVERRPLPACEPAPLERPGKAVAQAGRLDQAGPGPALRPGFTLCGLRARLVYDQRHVALERRLVVRTHADVAPVLAACLERRRGAAVAGLLDGARRLFAVAPLEGGDGNGCACQAVAPEAVYRAAIACGAHALVLAHGHAARGRRVAAIDRAWNARVYTLGRELGLELRDHLVFGLDGRYLSLRERGEGAPDWRVGDDLAATPVGLRLHQAHSNRRPQRPALTRSLSARAALRSCTACGRRSAIKAACPWCAAPRPRPDACGDGGHGRAAA